MDKLNILHIEIDCAPGSTRPGHYFKQILTILSKDTNHFIKALGERLLKKVPEPVSCKFGSWEWEISLNEDELLFSEDITNIWKVQLTELYNCNAIRYASWN